MFCGKCGQKRDQRGAFCGSCGAAAPASNVVASTQAQPERPTQASPARPTPSPATAQPQTSGKLLATVPIKGNGESVGFYDDRLEYSGNVIRYTDIAVMGASA